MRLFRLERDRMNIESAELAALLAAEREQGRREAQRHPAGDTEILQAKCDAHKRSVDDAVALLAHWQQKCAKANERAEEMASLYEQTGKEPRVTHDLQAVRESHTRLMESNKRLLDDLHCARESEKQWKRRASAGIQERAELIKERDRLMAELAALVDDARLGRMVRAMPQGSMLYHDIERDYWQARNGIAGDDCYTDTPEAVLFAAGIRDPQAQDQDADRTCGAL